MEEQFFDYLVLGWVGIALFAFIGSRLITAPYGRHASSKWGYMISNKWGWVIMELPALALCPLLYFIHGELEPISTFFVILWMIHYVHRTFIFPNKIRTKGKKMPLAIALLAVFFNAGNGFFNGYWFGHFSDYSITYLSSLQFLIGIVLFALGMYVNIKSDYHLIKLRKTGETAYKIPRGGWFQYISCPNHFGELLEWLGFAILVNSLPAWSFFIWTAANLIPRALSHHKWYKNTFEDYPSNRKAIIPKLI